MLLCLSSVLCDIFLVSFRALNWNGDQAENAGLRTRQGRAARVEGKLLLGHVASRSMGPGDGRRIVRRPARMRQPISGSGRPRSWWLADGCAEVVVDLAGDVTLEAADDFLLRQAFFATPLDVGAGRGCELIRVITIRHRAWLAWRSPPGLSRWRVTFPEEAGMGAAAHRCAQAASERSRSG